LATARELTEEDLPVALAAVSNHRDRMIARGRALAAHAEVTATELLARLLEEDTVVIIGDYLLAYHFAEGWLDPGTLFFQETLVLRITQQVGNSLRSVVREMERIARDHGCVGIHVGTHGADDERLGRVYQKLGFKTAPAEFHKEI